MLSTRLLIVLLLQFVALASGHASAAAVSQKLANVAQTDLQEAAASQLAAAIQAELGTAISASHVTTSGLHEAQACTTERHMVHCSSITQPKQRQICCKLYAPVAAGPSHRRLIADHQSVARSEAIALARTSIRVDLHPSSRPSFNSSKAQCFVPVQLPAIPGNNSKPVDTTTQFAPRLTSTDIKRVKAQAMQQLAPSISQKIKQLSWVDKHSNFTHPASIAGPAELVLMQHRLAAKQQPQYAAQRSLLTGGGVRPKFYTHPESGRKWAPPTDCPPEGYKGPYAIPEVELDWGGIDAKPPQRRVCAESFDPNAPPQLCGHLSFVELDAVMAYKQAVAWWATGDRRHASAALDIISAWSSNSSTWGMKTRNGPLEAGWGVAGMARALELLRSEARPELIKSFLHWVDKRLMPQMDWFVNDSDLGKGLHSNFHAAIVEAMAAVAVLSDDRGRWQKARTVFDMTVQRYLRWGKGAWAVGHVLGECTETQRDIFHTQMGLAGLLQTAEMAFQQDEDWYSSNNHALVAAVELHARIIRTAVEQNESMLPQGFRFFEHMPRPPKGMFWKFDLDRQIWAAINSSTGVRAHDKPDDGYKYMVGTDYLPAGWELAYNHYANRLGLKLPETAALLRRMWPEWYELYFGLGTLTHGHTAADLWVPGIRAGFKEC